MSKKKVTPEPTETHDVEGQSSILDPVMATRMTQDRTRDIERSLRERSYRDDARAAEPPKAREELPSAPPAPATELLKTPQG